MVVTLTPLQSQIKEIVFDNGNTYKQAAEWLAKPIGTINVNATMIRQLYAAAGQPLPDKRRHFVTH